MPKGYTYEVCNRGDEAAGFAGYTETVVITLDSGSPLGEPGQFAEYMRECLADWFDGATVRLAEPSKK